MMISFSSNPSNFVRKTELKRHLLVAALSAYLYLAGPRSLQAEDHISGKWQDYQEDDGRVRVLSKYLSVEKRLNESLGLRLHAVHDAISGATPTGSSGDSGDEVIMAEITDVRDAGVIDIDWTNGIHKTSFQYAHSKETDFLSKGYAIYNTSEFSKRNTGLSYGVSYVDDEINPSFFTRTENRRSFDAYVGINQIIDANTVASLNLSYGTFEGFLSDPYKVIKKDVLFTSEIIPDLTFTLPLIFAENRPTERVRRIAFGNVKRFFPELRGSLDVDYRFFDDNWGVESHTFDIEWYQRIGERIIVRPSYRIYQQNGSDFYFRDLTGTNIDPDVATPQAGPFYSADYRLAKLHTETYGLKVVYKMNDVIEFDLSWERYDMSGEDLNTPNEVFPDADVLTIGGLWWF